MRDLRVGCRLGERELADTASRVAFVDAGPTTDRNQAFVVWGEHGWPPSVADAEALATALSEGLGASHFEAFLALASARDTAARSRLLSLAGVHADLEAMELALGEGALDHPHGPEVDITLPKAPGAASGEIAAALPEDGDASGGMLAPMTPLYGPADLLIDGTPVGISGQPPTRDTNRRADQPRRPSTGSTQNAGYGGRTDLSALDRLGMFIAMNYELRRLMRTGVPGAAIFDAASTADQSSACVFDVSSPALITAAHDRSPLFQKALRTLSQHGVDARHPGCDILTLRPTTPDPIDRLIELKSSGQHARTQAMTWNEWKTAQSDTLRARFYLYLAANLRSDLRDARPFLRVVRDPYATMRAQEMVDESQTRRVVLHVSEFESAEELELGVKIPATETSKEAGPRSDN